MFSAASGLIANPNKSCIYFGGVNNLLQQQIMDILGYTKGELPFVYLGIPLSTKRLSAIQCEPLIERMLRRIQSWTIKFMSYAGRAVLVKSVLFAIQTSWAQIFILSKKIIHFIEAICKRFLWTGYAEPTKKALIAWDKLCLPKVAEGLNFTNVEIWNKVSIWLAIQQRLATKERLARWGIIAEQTCSLYNKEYETVHHLFFDCEISGEIWYRLLEWQGIRRIKKAWQEEVTWLEQVSKGKSAGATVCRMTLAARGVNGY
uniref:Reverse transcriptase zinc-binding domain-containing protein n=1 Tax=Nicotiana tabacum TaxID=4097 RepID=A0A1S3Y9Y0_TOBAC|nr:PREDICTED: uncharacterized protein LOC107774127 [Nicotiana tabacum]